MYLVLEGKIEQQVFVFNLNQKLLFFMLQHRLGREKNQSSDEKGHRHPNQKSLLIGTFWPKNIITNH